MNFNIFKKKSSSYDPALSLVLDLIWTLHGEGILNAQILADYSADRVINQKILNISDSKSEENGAINLQSLATALNKYYTRK